MRRNPSPLFSTILALFTLFILPATAQQKTPSPPEFIAWLPLADSERALTSALVEKDAGAEVLLWRVHVSDEITGQDLQRVSYNYIRLKIFNDKGKEQVSTIDLSYPETGGISEVAGRTIKADGSIVELDKKTVYKRDLVRAGRQSQKAISFAMPGIEPGAIVEYRWKEFENDAQFRYLRLHFARSIPVQRVTYFVKPLSSDVILTDQLFVSPFNCKPSPLKLETDGYNSLTVENVAASREEPYSPSDPNIEPWALLFYRPGPVKDIEKFWTDEGRKRYKSFKDEIASNSDLKAAAAEARAEGSGEDEKIAALAKYTQAKLRALSDPAVTPAERQEYLKRLPKGRSRTAVEILKSGIANSEEMNVAFGALATLAGLDARPAMIGDFSDIAFNPKRMADRYFLDDFAIAIKVGTAWRLVDASDRLLTPAVLPWREQGSYALICDPKEAIFVRTAVSAPEATVESRTANLAVSSDGSLKGDVDESYTGHRAEDLRRQIGPMSEPQRAEWLRTRMAPMFPDAEVTAIKIENVSDPVKPLSVHYRLDAPKFAQVTGKRIIFQPNAFRRTQGSPFTASERRLPVQFPYAWQELDEMHIRLPGGFEMDNPEEPGNIDFGKPGSYKTAVTVTGGAEKVLNLSRAFTFGAEGMVIISAENYPSLKKVFDEIQAKDGFSVSIKGN